MNIDPEIIQISTCGKYVYPVDVISGAKTFAPIDYFKKNVEKNFGGSVERFVAEYKTRETKKYLKAGHTPEQIRSIAENNNGKLPKINVKPKVSKKPRKKRVGPLAEKEIHVDEEGNESVVKVYPWTDNPDYFRSKTVPVDIAATSHDVCYRPDMYLDFDCHGCPIYNICNCNIKKKLKVRK